MLSRALCAAGTTTCLTMGMLQNGDISGGSCGIGAGNIELLAGGMTKGLTALKGQRE